jgi:hypothetical protein
MVSNPLNVYELFLVLCSVLIDGVARALLLGVFAKYLDLVLFSC